LYAPREANAAPADPAATMDRLVDIIVNKYAPLPSSTLSQQVMFLANAVPHWRNLRKPALARAKARLPHAAIEGHTWYWPEGENPLSRRHVVSDEVRLLAPFDPVVWDRRRFELFWGWGYRFEAYTPPRKRVRGYYALPLLWRDAMVGWGNLSVVSGRLTSSFSYAAGRAPRDPAFRRERDAELARIETFLGFPLQN
jgi:uncharacterized protein YcaQ